ncbi:hypothetical protein FHU41_000667 [Psychromicrobium silvestre]|uniref:F5/8 type C domain-containing protein n=1 Tax=Psychromicrobium silvestre TaxID=1645614 RepID=A0A7Y9S667_9MICC|nr:discoidin domain-containing protein [Psychromicrobium silvestre]NYE94446.1 hypothetical protein [Psychromicrobium silvestre]
MSYRSKIRRSVALGGALALTSGLLLATAPLSASAVLPASNYKVTMGALSDIPHTGDTPAGSYIDKDGTYYAQLAAALYGPNDPRWWRFSSGGNFNTSTDNSTINSMPDNANTTTRCNTSPTGLEASPNPANASDQRNYCDLMGVWVDPDTGDWYGLVHNEFTMSPFGEGMHYDAIDYAVSTNQGKDWTIKAHILTSPYSTTRNDTSAFPQQTYYYGEGDPRLYVDTASGYFYVYYNSRSIQKPGVSGTAWNNFEHVARAPMSAKFAPSSWNKWYNGSWSQPGIGGKESNMVPVDAAHPTGYTPVDKEYNPANPGSNDQQVAAGTMPSRSPLNTMNIIYDAYLGLYIGEPEVLDQNVGAPQQFYATDNLVTQKWSLIGDTGSFKTASWYRWMLDAANLTNPYITGKNFQSYFLYGGQPGGQATMSIEQNQMPEQPANVLPVDQNKNYQISAGNNRVLSAVGVTSATTSTAGSTGSGLDSWKFVYGASEGTYTIVNSATGRVLSVASGTTAARAWGAAPITTVSCGAPAVTQQWFIVANTDPATGNATGSYHLVNRYSGLVLALSDAAGRLSETTPTRAWTNGTGNAVGGTRTGAEQTLSFTEAGQPAIDLALGKPTTASSSEVKAGQILTANMATDGNLSTRWSSASADPQWLQVDLGSVQSIGRVKLSWEYAYGKAYQIQTSNDGVNWSTIYSTGAGVGGVQDLKNLTGTGRYVRMYGTTRGTPYGYSLWGFEVYAPADLAAGRPTTASSVQSGTSYTPDLATDGKSNTRWSSAPSDSQWLQVDLGSIQAICEVKLSWESAYAKAYQVQTSNDGTNWATVYMTGNGAGGVEDLKSLNGWGRYVRMIGSTRATGYGYSLWSFEVYRS